jgi:hypothetical protein
VRLQKEREGDAVKILVIGGTGNVGGAVVKELVKRGAKVRVLVRKQMEEGRLPAGVEVAIGDLHDPVSVEQAMQGVDKLYLLNDVVPKELTQGLIAYDLAKRRKVQHIVYHSVFRVEHFKDVPHFASKLAIENAVREFDIPFTIIRPNYFNRNDATLKDALTKAGIYPMPLGQVGISAVDIRDIAEAAAIALTSEGHVGKNLQPQRTGGVERSKDGIDLESAAGQGDSLFRGRHGCVRGTDEKAGPAVVSVRHPHDVSGISRTWLRRGGWRRRGLDGDPGA